VTATAPPGWPTSALPAPESLRCFVHAAQLLSFRAAARQVALTPAALGQRIRQREEQLGGALFVRTTRSVRLTEAGMALLPRAHAALAALAGCLQGEQAPPQALTLGTGHELGMSWLLPQLAELEAQRPGLTLHT